MLEAYKYEEYSADSQTIPGIVSTYKTHIVFVTVKARANSQRCGFREENSWNIGTSTCRTGPVQNFRPWACPMARTCWDCYWGTGCTQFDPTSWQEFKTQDGKTKHLDFGIALLLWPCPCCKKHSLQLNAKYGTKVGMGASGEQQGGWVDAAASKEWLGCPAMPSFQFLTFFCNIHWAKTMNFTSN